MSDDNETSSKQAMIFGAGKIGRGFLGHLLHRSGYRLTYVDASPVVVARLAATGSYTVHVLGAPEKDVLISGVHAIALSDERAVIAAAAEHDLFFSSVGGANLPAVGNLLGRALLLRTRAGNVRPVNLIVCENYKDPAKILRDAIIAGANDEAFARWQAEHLGIAETQVLRSCIDPTDDLRRRDPLSVQVQDWWVLPCDADAVRGPAPQFEGLSLRRNFGNELVRKVYTYNCSNATISYLGWLRGYEMLSEAANDEEILAVTQAVYDESGRGLIAEFGFDPKDQKDLQELAITKYKDRKILDPIERNGRDTRRKLSPQDRLLGPANIAIKHGVEPKHLALAMAAGLHYEGSDDDGTKYVQQSMATRGLAATIEEICALKRGSKLFDLILTAVPQLARFNRRGVRLITE